jgi:hypothetical protein
MSAGFIASCELRVDGKNFLNETAESGARASVWIFDMWLTDGRTDGFPPTSECGIPIFEKFENRLTAQSPSADLAFWLLALCSLHFL